MTILNFAKAAIFDEGEQILLLRRSATDPRRPGDWDFPGGQIEEGEEFAAGVAREITEEAGLRVPVTDLKAVYAATEAYEDGDQSVNRVLFVAKVSRPEVRLSYEHDDFKWVDIDTALHDFRHPFYSVGLEYAREHDLL